VAVDAKVHVIAECLDDEMFPVALVAEAGKGQEWLGDALDLYSYADLVERVES
jgi:hypothetical protein